MKQLENYLSLCAEYYDLQPHRDETAAMPFYMRYALQAQGLVLEPMCGTGRFLIPMLQAGIAIEGFDASPSMLALLHKKHKNAPVSQCFAQDFAADKKYALIFIPYGSWGLIINRVDARTALQTLYESLETGGTFLVEIETVASVPKSLNIWHRSIRKRADGSYIALNTVPSYNIETQVFTALCRYESLVQGTIVATEEEIFKMYLYNFDEMDALLKEVGFTQIKKFQDFAGTVAHDVRAPLLIYECKK